MEKLIELIQKNQSFLLKRTLYYAKRHDYVKYTSTLEEAWVASISGLSDALVECIKNEKEVPEIDVDQDFLNDQKSIFGVTEARKHRERGITLEMFLGLMKYYRQSYLDLIWAFDSNKNYILYSLWINRFFDQNEIAFCVEWNEQSGEALLSELQNSNRALSNEKNRYLTIFESIPAPVILLDDKNICHNINFAAQQLFFENVNSPGHIYYSESYIMQSAKELLPWMIEDIDAFCRRKETETTIEKVFDSPENGKRNLNIKFHRMLDVSGKFEGTVIIFTDQTELKQIEEQLRSMSFHDALTGLYNRTYLIQEFRRIITGRFNPVGIISCDIDGLKLVNDNLGHHSGDALIIAVGNLLLSCFSENDVVCRIGGDEFLVVMHRVNDETVVRACRRIRDQIAEYNTKNKLSVSISIGWSVGNLIEIQDAFEAIKEADNQMYSEKKENHIKYTALFSNLFSQYGKGLIM